MNFKIIYRYGLYSSAFLIATGLLLFFILGPSPEYYDIGEILGYSSITLSLVFIYFGIRQYRNDQLNGFINFGQATKVGLLIALFPALAFGLYNLVYVEFLDPEFMENYYQHQLQSMQNTMSSKEFESAKAQMEAEKDMFMSPITQFFVMFLTVWIIGMIITLISSFSLTKKRNLMSKKKVTGVGGIFFKSKDPEKAKNWYRDNLGLVTNEYGSLFEFRHSDEPDQKGYLQWSPFQDDTKYFEPSQKEFMINFRVENMEELVEELKANGVQVLDDIESFEYGKFVHIMDLEGNKIELWEPIDSSFTELYEGKTTK